MLRAAEAEAVAVTVPAASLPQPVHGLPDPGLAEPGLQLGHDLVDEELRDARAGTLGLVEGVPQLLDGVEVGARVGVARVPRRRRRVAAVAGVQLEDGGGVKQMEKGRCIA